MGTRSKQTEVNNKNVQNSLTKVFFIDKQLIKEENEIHKIDLPRKTSLFIKGDNEIYELLQFNEKNRCFFIDNTVCSNGKIYITTKIDPLFVFIQYVEEHCKSKAQPVEQIIDKSADIFLDVLKLEQMRLVADQKGPDDLRAFVFNEQKVLKWLQIKFKRIEDSLKKQNIINAGSSSMNFVQSTLDCDSSENQDEIQATALGIISEYISLDLYDKLDKIYGISEKSKEPISQKRKSTSNQSEPGSKKIKCEEGELKENNTTSVKSQPTKPVKNAAKLEKAAKNTKSIASFFTKK